jgi:hypothetical protein
MPPSPAADTHPAPASSSRRRGRPGPASAPRLTSPAGPGPSPPPPLTMPAGRGTAPPGDGSCSPPASAAAGCQQLAPPSREPQAAPRHQTAHHQNPSAPHPSPRTRPPRLHRLSASAISSSARPAIPRRDGKQSRCPMRRPPHESRHGERRQAGTACAIQTGNVGHPVREQAPDLSEVTANWSNTSRILNQHRTSNSVPLAYANPPMPGGAESGRRAIFN